MDVNAIILGEKDNVATVTSDISDNEPCNIAAKNENLSIVAKETIPFGHKIALQDIPKGSMVMKYNEPIGHATKDIFKGEHVHTQNLAANRGRGDVKKNKDTE